MSLKMYQENSLKGVSKVKNIIAIAAGKGGVGKSCISAHLAYALNKLNKKVGVLDADVYGPSIQQIIPEDKRADQKEDILIPADKDGIKLMSLSYFKNKNESTAVRAPIANSIISQFLLNTNWGELDFLIIDFPPGTGDIQLTLAQKVPLTAAIIITTPQEVCLLDVEKAMKMFEIVNVPILGIIENMSYFKHPNLKEIVHIFGSGGGQRLADKYQLKLLTQLPLDPAFCKACDLGENIQQTYPQSDISKIFITLAQELVKNLDSFSLNNKLASMVSIAKIWQENKKEFFIKWSDGKIQSYDLLKLQQNCPCIECKDKKKNYISENIQAKKLYLVGQYAVGIEFTQGCSKGIFDYEFLRAFE